MRIVVTLFVVWVRAAVTLFVTDVYAVFVPKLFSTPAAVVSVVPISLRTVVVSVISVVSSSVVLSLGSRCWCWLEIRVRVRVI